MKDFTIVVPVSSKPKDVFLFKNILYPTLEKLQCEILIVSNEPFGTVKDSNFKRKGCLDGWRFQQCIKLDVAKIIKTEWYLCLDSDCFVTGFSSLFYNDKPKLNIEKTPEMPIGHHAEWWIQASTFLQLPVPSTWCGVTPMFLHTKTVKSMFQKHTYDKLKHLINMGATEYSLYWTYFCSIHEDYRHYYCSQPLSFGIYDKSFGQIDSSLSDLTKAFNNFKNFPIGLIQSTLNYNEKGLSSLLPKLWKTAN